MNNEQYIGCKQLGTGFLVRTLTRGEVIGILDNNEENVMNEYYKGEEVLVKIKPDQMAEATAELASDARGSGQTRIANRQFEDYELYTTVKEEEQLMLATVEANSAGDEDDEEVLAAVAIFFMVHCEEKEGIKTKKKKKHA